ncbi:MAG: hypothetical protein ACFE8J_18885 [Candidatus Heimdallarchaeota archaeon]
MELLVEQEELIRDIRFFFKVFKLFKSYLILLSDQKEMGIGDVTLASPPTIEGIKSTSSSYKLFGVGDDLLSTIIAERSSFILNAPVLLMIFIKNKEEKESLVKLITEFVNRSLETIKKGT